MRLKSILCLIAMCALLSACGDDNRHKSNNTKMSADKLKELQEKSALRQSQELNEKPAEKK